MKTSPLSCACHRKILLAIALSFSVFVPLKPAHAQLLFWDADGDTTAGTGGDGSWDGSLWRNGSAVGTLQTWTNASDAYLGGTAGTLALSTGITVNDIFSAPTSGTAYEITGAAQTLTLGGTTKPALDVAAASSLALTSRLAGTQGFTKSSGGTLILDAPQGSGSVFGSIAVTGGTLQAGSATNSAASQVLRSNAVDLGAGTSLTTVGTTIDLRVGALSGSGSITPATGGAINVQALSDTSFSGAITTTGGLNLRGANGTTQTFNGNLTALTGTIGINSGATLTLSGTGTTAGVFGSTAALTARGGTLLLDNTSGNTSAANGRLGDAAVVTLGGGSVSLIGNSAGTTETVGAFTQNSGSSTISVTNNGGTGAVLAFTDTGSLRDSTSGTLNFVGLGTGTLGSAGNAPRITFSGALNANTVNGALTSSVSSATSVTYGWARVNDTSWAGNGANGIVALAETARNSATLGSAAANEITTFTPSTTTTTLSANLGAAATSLLLKITPSAAAQSLASGGFSINASAVMLAGTTDFSITGTGSLFGTVASTRYVYTTDANAVFSISQSFAGANQPFGKSGAGTVFLNGATNQLGFTGNQSVNVLEGTLRGTLTTLGGGTSAGGAFAQLNLYGGVLEISGGGTFSRALTTSNATASGGTIRWDNNNSSQRGDGGFSAIGGNATVSLVTAIGGTTASAPNWNDVGFVQNGYSLTMGSTKADSRIDFTNNIGLDNGTATNSYFAREIRVADNTGSTADIARLSGNISGSANADLLKTGGGTLELTGAANSYAGNTLVQQGTLIAGGSGSLSSTSGVVVSNGGTLLLGASGTSIGNSVPLILAGGKFSTGGNSEGDLTTTWIGSLSSSTTTSVIDFGTTGPSTVNFSSIGSVTGTLSVWNWTSGDRFFVTSGTIGEYGQVNFYDGDNTLNNLTALGGGGAFLVAAPGGNFELVPVPEVGALFGALGLLAPLAWRERRHWMRCREARVLGS